MRKGQWNKLIDSFVHPYAKGKNKVPVLLLDGLLHTCIERNARVSLKKFIRYNLSKMLK